MVFAKNFIAVGIASDKEAESCVVISLQDGNFICLNEAAARKLADDLIRNANHLWPGDEMNETEGEMK